MSLLPSSSVKVPHKQQGLALVISLVLLIAMTIVAMATMSGTRLNERITSNAQQKAISFEAAESAINTVWNKDAVISSLNAIPISQPNDPLPVSDATVNATLSTAFDQTKTTGTGLSVDITASVSIQYCGETNLPKGTSLSADESGIQFVGLVVDVNGLSNIAGSNANSDHLQRGYVRGPKTGRTGNCVTPG